MLQVISASRRTDIPAWYARWLAARLREGSVEVQLPYGGRRLVSLQPEEVHTIVLWSKDFSPVLRNEGGVRTMLGRYEQLFCHFTITGLGGTPLEPRVPRWREALAQLPEVVELCGDPRRVVLRFDPIVHWYENGEVRSNLRFAEPIFQAAARDGLEQVIFSFATLYPKVRRRWERWYDPPLTEKLRIAAELKELAQALGLELRACAQPELTQAGVRPARCIDGALLEELHPRRLPAPQARDRGQRPECLCTQSIDIGAYTMGCPGGCRYCYANPVRA